MDSKPRKRKLPPFWTTAQTAVIWGIAERNVRRLCEMDRVEGAFQHGRNWIIPAGTPKPPELRRGRRPRKRRGAATAFQANVAGPFDPAPDATHD